MYAFEPQNILAKCSKMAGIQRCWNLSCPSIMNTLKKQTKKPHLNARGGKNHKCNKKKVRLVYSPNVRPNIRKESMTDIPVVVLFAHLFTKRCTVCAKKSQGEVTTARELVMRVDSLNQFTWQKCITKRVYFYRRKILVLGSWQCKCTMYKERDPKGIGIFPQFFRWELKYQ